MSHKIAQPLALIINQSLNTGQVPSILKIAKVKPVYKKNDNTICDNYRPISLLPIVSKIFERVVHKQLSLYLSENKLLFKSQHGFRQNHSTETATLELVDKVMKHLDNNETPISIFIDLSKAFDTLNHDILLHKLSFYGIRGTALNWFSSYLSNRYQFVEYLNCKSTKLPITTGVLQGSILGPLLFNIYMNDISQASSVFDFLLYADDTTLTCSFEKLQVQGRNENIISAALNDELDKILVWLTVNKLSLNPSKTKYIIFHLPQKPASVIPSPKLNICESNK